MRQVLDRAAIEWKRLNDEEVVRYAHCGEKGLFSYSGMPEAMEFGKVVSRIVKEGSILDVGCGCLELPEYMRYTKGVSWTGIDPHRGESKKFTRIVGVAESLPFANETFSAVTFATSLDHLLNPSLSIKEAMRVLKPHGYILIWTGLFLEDKKFKIWKDNPGSKYDRHHLWGFTKDSLLKLCSSLQLVETKEVIKWSWIYVFRKL